MKLKNFVSSTFDIFKEACVRFGVHNVPRLSASLSYYTAFSIAPLMILTVTVVGAVFGPAAAEGKVVEELSSLLGRQGAHALQSMLRNLQNPSAHVSTTIIATVLLLVGASGAMTELKDALNLIWGVKGKSGVRIFFKERLLSIGMVAVIGFLLLVSVLISAGLGILGEYFKNRLPVSLPVLETINFFVSFGVISFLFAVLFKGLPDADIEWHDVWVGAILTSFLFTVGKSLLGVYLSKQVIGSAYGAAGSVLVMLIWVYYSAQTLYFGAEFTKIFSDCCGKRIRSMHSS